MSADKPPLTALQIRLLLIPYLQNTDESASIEPDTFLSQLAIYLGLLTRWNRRTNLTSIRNPEEIVQRHFGESLFLAEQIASRMDPDRKLLDFGSGAGFPGLPAKLRYPEWKVTLAESQHKKVSFLREVVRVLQMECDIWPNRVELWPAQTDMAVMLRAVDHMGEALRVVLQLRPTFIAVLTSRRLASDLTQIPEYTSTAIPVPMSDSRLLILLDSIAG